MNSKTTESECSTPYASAPTSPARTTALFYSCPPSPVRSKDLEFEFCFLKGGAANFIMSSADELFLDGKIRATKGFSAANQEGDDVEQLRVRSKSRRSRSMSPSRTGGFEVIDDVARMESDVAGSRRVKRWEFLKELLYRSKSEGGSGSKFWMNVSLREKKEGGLKSKEKGDETKKKGKSAHEAHYRASKAQAEEMRKKTFLPYRQGLIGCLGFSSKGYSCIARQRCRALFL